LDDITTAGRYLGWHKLDLAALTEESNAYLRPLNVVLQSDASEKNAILIELEGPDLEMFMLDMSVEISLSGTRTISIVDKTLLKTENARIAQADIHRRLISSIVAFRRLQILARLKRQLAGLNVVAHEVNTATSEVHLVCPPNSLPPNLRHAQLPGPWALRCSVGMTDNDSEITLSVPMLSQSGNIVALRFQSALQCTVVAPIRQLFQFLQLFCLKSKCMLRLLHLKKFDASS